MTDQDPRSNDFGEIDALLRRSLGAPVPALPPNFEEELHGRLRRNRERDARVLSPYRRIFLASYGVVSAVTSIAVLRAQGLDWSTIALLVLSPCALLAALSLSRRRAPSGRP